MDKNIELNWNKWPSLHKVATTYERVMKEEDLIHGGGWQWPEAKEAYGAAQQTMRVAKLCLTPRSANGVYNNYDKEFVPFSVGGHTLLALFIGLQRNKFLYGTEATHDEFGYSWLERIEFFLRHDQAEEETGDSADNKARDERLKNRIEQEYFLKFSHWSPERDRCHEYVINHLLDDFVYSRSYIGRAEKVDDKSSAPIESLASDAIGEPYLLRPDSPHISDHDLEEMGYCEYSKDGAYYASEMWSVDYFKLRHFVNIDDYGYDTALLVMCTLLVNNNHWYVWREADYIHKR